MKHPMIFRRKYLALYKGVYDYSRGIVRDYVNQHEKERILTEHAEDLNYYCEFDDERSAHAWLADLLTILYCDDEY